MKRTDKLQNAAMDFLKHEEFLRNRDPLAYTPEASEKLAKRIAMIHGVTVKALRDYFEGWDGEGYEVSIER